MALRPQAAPELDRIGSAAPDRLRPEPDLSAVVVNQLAVRQAFDELRAPHREILALIDIAGFGYAELADILGVPKGTVMSRVSRARQELCRRLALTAATPLRDGAGPKNRKTR